MQTRRSRMRRTPTGKRLALTSRDIAIFRALSRYRYLPSTYLHAFVGGVSHTRFKERLGNLFHEGFVERPAKQWEFAGARYSPAIYELGAGAKRVLSDSGNGDVEPVTFLSAPSHRQFAHAVAICEALASFELAAHARPDVRFIAWPEILARASLSAKQSAVPWKLPGSSWHVVPDGFFGFEYSAGGRCAYRFFALELDRGTMPVMRSGSGQTSYFGKLSAYRDIISRQSPTGLISEFRACWSSRSRQAHAGWRK